MDGTPVGTIMPQAPSSAPSRSSRPSRRSRSNGPGSDSSPVLSCREAEAGVVRRVAEQDHRAMAARLGRRQRVIHQRSSRRRARGTMGSTASGPSTSAGTPPALTCHNRTVPTNFPWRTAEKARPSAGARPSRRRWQVRKLRFAPKQASSSASRATTSEARSRGSRTERRRLRGQSGSSAKQSWHVSPRFRRRCEAEGSVVSKFACEKEGSRRTGSRFRASAGESGAGIRCGRSAAAGSR